MIAKDFSTFTQMVDVAKQKDLEYIIMYSYHSSNSTNYPHSYSFILATNLFIVTFNKKYGDGNDDAVRNFIQCNDCTQLDCDIRINSDQIELY